MTQATNCKGKGGRQFSCDVFLYYLHKVYPKFV